MNYTDRFLALRVGSSAVYSKKREKNKNREKYPKQKYFLFL